MPSLFELFQSKTRTTFIAENVSATNDSSKTLLIMDATISERHRTKAIATENSVEVGSDIADNVDVRPREYDIDAVITDAPITFLNALVGNLAGAASALTDNRFVGSLATTAIATLGGALLNGSRTRSLDAYNTLLDIQGYKRNDTAQGLIFETGGRPVPITIITGLTIYNNMILTELNVERTASIGRKLQFTGALKEIRVVESKLVKIPPKAINPNVRTSAADKSSEGKKTANEANGVDSNSGRGSSILIKGAKGVAGVLGL